MSTISAKFVGKSLKINMLTVNNIAKFEIMTNMQVNIELVHIAYAI